MICKARIPRHLLSLNFNRSPIFLVLLALFSAILLTACTGKQQELPEARVAAIVTEGQAPFSVDFTHASKNANEFVWNFGDGEDSETTNNKKNMTHLYEKAGKHKVTLQAIFRATEDVKRPETDSANLTITVKPGKLDSVTIEAATVEAGGVHEFAPAAFDEFGNPISGLTYVYSAADDAAGKFESDGRFRAGTKVGVYENAVTVEVTQEANTQTTAASVTLVPGPLNRVSLEPSELTLEVTEQIHFTATAFDQFDNPLSGLTYIYTVDQQAGQVDKQGLFEPGTILGTYPKGITVRATQGEVTRRISARVSLVPGPRSIVSWWAGDGDASDIVGDNHGALTGDFAPGMVGQAFKLGGTADFIEVPGSTNLNITGDVTVDLWAKRTVFQRDNRMVYKGAGFKGTADLPTAYSLSFNAKDRLLAFLERENGTDVELIGPIVSDDAFHHYS